MLVTLKDILQPAHRQGYAVIAPDFPTLSILEVLISRAEHYQAPLILSWAPEFESGMDLSDINRFFRIARELAKDASVPLALHLDHANNLDDIQAAIDRGFTSVMIDASMQPYEANLEITRTVVDLAHAVGVSVESELGVIGTGEQDYHHPQKGHQLTDPDQAITFAVESGVDALAVAIGTVHGRYRGEPNLDFYLLERLGQEVPIPLVLHGGSGTGESNLSRAISLGIRKINLFSDMLSAFQKRLSQSLSVDQPVHLTIKNSQQDAITEVLDSYITISGSAGKGAISTQDTASRATQLFQEGYYCSEAVFNAFAEREGFSADLAQLVLSMMGGGLSNQGQVCGAILGGLAVLGARHSRVNPNDLLTRQAALAKGKTLIEAISSTHASIDCVKLTGINFNIPEQAQRYVPEGVATKVCIPIIQQVCEWLNTTS